MAIMASLDVPTGSSFSLTTTILLLLVAAGPAYIIFKIAYNIFFHPLRAFPGPLANRATILPDITSLMGGRRPYLNAELHARYGSIVRIAPNRLAITDPDAWRDIYTRRGGGLYEMPQDQDFYNANNVPHPSLLGCDREEHDAVRKLLNTGFSDRAMKAQEPMIGRYVDLLIQRLHEGSAGGNGAPKSVNMRDWYAFTTFDVLGKLAFGSDFGCLEDSAYHPWVHLIIGNVKDLAIMICIKALGIEKQLMYVMSKLGVGQKKRALHVELTTERVKQRIAMGTGHDDFLDGLVKSDMSFDQITRNAGLLIVAGSETTATLLAGVTFFIATHPIVMEKLKTEVRGRFSSEDDITLTSVNGLTYMLAVLNEALRVYPPAPNGAPRRVPPGGATIAGHYIPENSVIGIELWSEFHNPNLFTDPDRFDPERWIDRSEKSKYANDRLDVVKPFLTGPRNCLGQNLAYAEMRLILARVIWNFDMKLSDECRGWMDDQKSYMLWDKPDLNVYLTPAKR